MYVSVSLFVTCSYDIYPAADYDNVVSQLLVKTIHTHIRAFIPP